jgi:3-hydroxy-9,10-secoandrosta-1,3,5(10)-triene-9,17-dione monooxygenase
MAATTASETTPTHDALVARGAGLIAELRARRAEAETLRRLPDANIAAVRAAGLLKVLQARSCGGYEMSIHTHLDVVATIGRGCGATAWCMGVMHAHSWLLALYPEAAQDDVFGARSDVVISAVIAPRGLARIVPGGYVLSGTWPFASGCEHSDWLLLGAAVAGESGVVDEGDLLVPTADVTIKDDWHVAGLRGTGSCSVAVKDLFVPPHRFLSLRAAGEGKAPGLAVNAGTLYRSAIIPFLTLALVPAGIGIAEAALADFTTRLPGRMVAYTAGEQQMAMPVTHLQLAEAATKIDTARLIAHNIAEALETTARGGATMPPVARVKLRVDCAYAARLCLEAVEILYLASGGSGIAETNPVQQAWRDLHAVNMHGILNLQTAQELYGRVLLGLPPNSPFI